MQQRVEIAVFAVLHNISPQLSVTCMCTFWCPQTDLDTQNVLIAAQALYDLFTLPRASKAVIWTRKSSQV